ncbi:MAG: polysaccharide biosynthesis C-terminal domain-containing protein [Alphaproteobacteria bacterium]|nr:MAG: polysaccharide biosynthesis C-terminal domain-containing protein [Alphaproteobacteria bacterium]
MFVLSSMFIAFFTVLARFLGYIRDLIVLSWVGVSHVSDAYMLVVKFPSLLKKIISDGSTNTIMIPILKEVDGQHCSAKQFMNHIAKLIFTRVLLILLIALICINYVVRYFLYGLNPITQFYFIKFAQIIWISLLFLGISSVYIAFLNYKKSFKIASFSNIICNTSCIFFMYIFYKLNLNVLFIAISILVAHILQFAWLAYYVHSIENRDINKSDDVQIFVEKFKKRFINIIFSCCISQIMIFFSSWVMSHLEYGNITYLSLADRVMQVPLSVIGIVISSTFLTLLTDKIKTNEVYEARKLYKRVVLLGLFLSFFMSIVIAIFSFQIAYLMFYRGHTTIMDIHYISTYLRIYIMSIPAYAISKIINAVFFAYGNTTIPFKAAVIQFISNVILVFYLFKFKGVGISIAFLISSWIYTMFLFICLHSRLIDKKKYL